MSSQLANIQSLSGPRPPVLRIPREIRDMIYDTVFDGATLSLVFQNSRSDPGENKIHCTQKPATDLLMVSRQVHQEALTRFRFHLNVEDDYCGTQGLDAEDLHLTSSMRWALTSLKADVDLVRRPFSSLYRVSQCEVHHGRLAGNSLCTHSQCRERRSGYVRRPR